MKTTPVIRAAIPIRKAALKIALGRARALTGPGSTAMTRILPQNISRLQTHWGRSFGSTPMVVPAAVLRLSAQENPLQDPHHYQTEGRVNKNGSQKRRERHARGKLSRY